jgi:hypothetical protein
MCKPFTPIFLDSTRFQFANPRPCPQHGRIFYPLTITAKVISEKCKNPPQKHSVVDPENKKTQRGTCDFPLFLKKVRKRYEKTLT